MILHNVPTESDGKLIRSSGAYHIRVTRNDQTLGLKEGVEIEIQIPIEGQWSEKMELFYGERHPDGQFNWVEADNDPNSQNNVWLGEMYDSLTQEWGLSYQLYSSQLNWINCDEFMEAGELVKLDVALPETYSDTNTVAFIVFDQLNAVMAMQWNANEKVFTENYVPINETVTLLIIAERGDNDFYFSSLNTTVTADKVIEMSPEEIPLGDIVEFISGL